MVGTKITRPRNGRHKNNSPKGWTDGKLNGRHDLTVLIDGWQKKVTRQGDGRVESYMVGTKRNSPKDGELNG